MKFSNKDFLLLFGILVAVIITLTTIVFNKESSDARGKTSQNSIKPATSLAPSGLIKKAIDKIEFNSLIR